MSSITDDVKKVVLAGIGAAAMTVEKAQEVAGECIKKGEAVARQISYVCQTYRGSVRSKTFR